MKYASVSFDLTKQYHKKLTSDPIIECILQAIENDIEQASRRGLYRTNVFIDDIIERVCFEKNEVLHNKEELISSICSKIEEHGYIHKLCKDILGHYINISWEGIYNK